MTDWNAELDLLKQYVDWTVDNWFPRSIILNIENLTISPEKVMEFLMQTGVLYVNSAEENSPETHLITFEQWKEQILLSPTC